MAERNLMFFEDLDLGMEASLERVVTEADIVAFAEVSGDKNPVHMDADYAAGTMFKQRISHGMLTASYISAVFGMELPGPGAIYISQTLNFRRPVMIGDSITATVAVLELWPAKRREVVVDFTKYMDGSPTKKGDVVYLVNVMKMMTGRMWDSADPKYQVPVMKIVIGDDPPVPDYSQIPYKLREVPDLVPGVLFCNRALSLDDPEIVDLAPTTLDLFGIEKPAYMDGKSLVRPSAASGPQAPGD